MRTNGTIQLYPLARVAIAFIIGICAGEELKSFVMPELWLWLCGLSVLVSLALYRFCMLQSILLMLSFIMLGGWMVSRDGEQRNVSLPSGYVSYDAVLVTEPIERGKVIQVDMIVIGAKSSQKVKASILRDTLRNRHGSLHVGDGIKARSRLEKPSGRMSTGFDYGLWLTRHGYIAQTFIYHDKWEKAEIDLRSLSIVERTRLAAMKIRSKLLKRYRELGLDDHEYAVVAAMTLGDKSLISKDIREYYSISGASHLLAISGLHVGIIYAVLSFCLLGFRKSWLSQILVLTAIWTYVFLTGMSPSVLRAAVMLSIYSMVSLLHRDSFSLNTLAFAALTVLAFNPVSLYDVGFQLSFMSVLAILAVSPMAYSTLPDDFFQRHRVMGWTYRMVVLSVAAQVGTAPLVAFYFGRFPCYFLISNFIAIPCTMFILYGAVATLALSWIPSLQEFIVRGVGYVSSFMNWSLSQVSSLPFASIDGIRLSALQVLMAYVFIGSVLIAVAFWQRRTFFRN